MLPGLGLKLEAFILTFQDLDLHLWPGGVVEMFECFPYLIILWIFQNSVACGIFQNGWSLVFPKHEHAVVLLSEIYRSVDYGLGQFSKIQYSV